MNVDDDVKDAYRYKNSDRYIIVTFPELELVVGNDQIKTESLNLKESIMESDNVEFVGCIASCFSIQINNISQDIKGKKIEVQIYTGETVDNPITLFNGIVDSALQSGTTKFKEVTAYDVLYTKGNNNVSSWYNELTFPLTLKDFRDKLFTYLGIEQETTELPNDDLMVGKEYNPTSLKAIDVIKAICQINGVFGIINRSEKFEYRVVKPIDDETNIETFPAYKEIKYEEYTVKPVDRLTIRKSEDDDGTTYGTGINNYIIQGNMFTANLGQDELLKIAENIYPNVGGIFYNPFTSKNTGLPWIECGKDAVKYKVLNADNTFTEKTFYVFSRTLSGIQALTDSYSADGEEYQREFITDVSSEIESIKTQIEGYKDELAIIIKTFTNSKAISLSSSEKTLIEINVSTISEALPIFLTTIPLEMLKDGNIIIRYYVDNMIVNNDTVVNYFDSGKQIVTLVNHFDVAKNAKFQLKVTAQMEYYESETRQQQADINALIDFANSGEYVAGVIDDSVPTAEIDAYAIKAVLFAQGFLGSDKWDGTLYLEDMIERISIDKSVDISTIHDNLITLETQEPLSKDAIAETIDSISLCDSIQIANMLDILSLEPILLHYIFDVSKSEYYTYNTEYVENTDAFKLRTDYVFEGSEQTIDSGRMSEVNINFTKFASVESVVIE